MRFAPLAALLCVAFLVFAGSAAANTFTVTTTADDVGTCDPGDCSVREALAAADANFGADTVSIPAGHYVLTQGELHIDEIDDTLNIVGAGARSTILDGNGQSRVLFIDDGFVSISYLMVTGGNSDQGAGIFENDQQLTLDHVAVVGNSAVTLPNDPTFGGQGGGIFANEPVTMTNSVVSGNVADGAGASFSGGQGGGIFANEPVTLTNVTIANNQAKPAPPGATFPHSQGGGVFVNETSDFKHVTIAGNSASGDDAGGGLFINEDMTFTNSLVAGNTVDGVPNNCVINFSTVTEVGHNLQGTTDCGFAAAGDITADPLLGALADNGGETDTEALLSGSPAIDHADNAVCPAVDQRDLPRPALGGCDIGAFEVQPAAAAPSPAPPAAADTTKPKVSVAGVRAACVSSASLSVRVRATDASGVKSTRVTLDGKRIHTKNKTRFTIKINIRKLSAGRHVLRIVTTDAAGNRTSTRRTITRCAKPAAKPRRQAAPRFTG
jgi:hypothetical protein